MPERICIDGAVLWRGHLSREAQAALAAALRDVASAAPFMRPTTRWGKPMRVRMTSAGALGWVSDRRGYRYVDRHPETGAPWPSIPQPALDVWAEVAPDAPPTDSCLVNFYDADARMGLHQDKDEADFSAPVVSISLGDAAVFRLGGPEKSDPTRSFRLESGDVLVLGGRARLARHGVDRIIAGSSTLLPAGGAST